MTHIFEVPLPDGEILEIEAPEDTPPEKIRERARAYLAQKAPAAEPPPQTSFMDDAKRELGLGARSMIQGGLSTIGILSDPAAKTFQAATGTQIPTAREGGVALADALSLPTPETSNERLGGAVTEALTGTGGFIRGAQALAPALQGVPQRVATSVAANPGSQLVAATTGASAADTAREQGAGPGGQVLAGLAGALAPATAGATVRGVVRGASPQGVRANIDDFSRAGAGVPSAGQATEGRFYRGLEALLGRTPGGAGIIADRAEQQAAGIGAKAEEVAGRLAPKSSGEQAGRAIERGVSSFMSGFKAQAGRLYDEVDKALPPNSTMPVTNTQAALARMASPTPGAVRTSQVMASPKIAQLRDALDGDIADALAQAGKGELPYGAVKALRSRLGELISDSTFSADLPTKQLRAVYGALSDDLTAAAKASGNPKAVQAASRANSYFKAGMARIEQLERVVERNGGPEKVFAAAMSGQREGATTLRAVMQSLPADGQKQLAATVLRRMGRANPSAQDDLGEVFSPETFLTNWNQMAPEARKAVFDRFGPRHTADLDAIARVATNMRQGAQVFRNPPGTAAGVAQGATGASFLLSILLGQPETAAAIAGGVATANLFARTLTSEVAVRWLARQTKLPVSALAVQVKLLEAEAEKTGDEQAAELARALQDAEGTQ